MVEPKENIGLFCGKECLKRVGRLKTYPNVSLEKFIGKYIKAGFPITLDLQSELPRSLLIDANSLQSAILEAMVRNERKEHMWVFVQEITKDGNLRGSLNNDPVLVNYVKYGDFVEISRDEIELCTSPNSNKFLSEKDLMLEGNNESQM